MCISADFSFIRLILPGKENAMTKMITNSRPNTVYYDVKQNNVRKDLIFPHIQDQVKSLLNDAHTTLWSLNMYVLTTKEYSNCLVCMKLITYVLT